MLVVRLPRLVELSEAGEVLSSTMRHNKEEAIGKEMATGKEMAIGREEGSWQSPKHLLPLERRRGQIHSLIRTIRILRPLLSRR